VFGVWSSWKVRVAFAVSCALGCARGPKPVTHFLEYAAPAGDLPTTKETTVDGRPGAVLPSGRFITPVGRELEVMAPRPFGLAVSPDGATLATINSGPSKFSVTLVRADAPPVRIDLDATFMGVVFSSDGARFFASGGDNGNVWVGDVARGRVVGSINLNGRAHPLPRPLTPTATPASAYKGAFPGNMALSADGRYLYVVDQASFAVHVVDTTAVIAGTDAKGDLVEPDNFAAVVGRAETGRVPFGIGLARDGRTLYVTNVGVYQYAHLRPAKPAGDKNEDYPLCIPGVGYPDEVEHDRTITIQRIDARTVSGLPPTLRIADGIRCGYVSADRRYTIPGLGSPNAAPGSSVYAYALGDPRHPVLTHVVKTGALVGEIHDGIATYGASHPNAVVAGRRRVYVSNGNDDTVTVLDGDHLERVGEIELSLLPGLDARLKGAEPVSLALSPDERVLYVAEAGLNAVAVIDVGGRSPRLLGHIPTGWWPSSVKVAPDGRTLFVVAAKGRGAGPNTVEGAGTGAKHAAIGTVAIVPVPTAPELATLTRQVLRNNGMLGASRPVEAPGPIPLQAGEASRQIKHVVFINKENATHDLLLGDVTATRRGVAVDGDPAYSLGPLASPNHHELALEFAFGDNFYLEPTVSSDGHRWLTNNYPTETEETHWPAAYGHKRRPSGDDPEIVAGYPGRVAFSDGNASPEPGDLNAHGGIYMHLHRHGRTFANFGNGFELAQVDEERGTEPTGIREHVNIPMETVVRENTDHLYPEFNTTIPDSPLPEEPDRFNRFGRFAQVFEALYVDRVRGLCTLPDYVDLYYPNDHGGGPDDIHPSGPAWDYTRYVQDNDAALGLTVDLLSKSPCWKDTVIFVVEDDTQNGLDHVNGYRSLFLAIGPWVKRETVTKHHLSLASVFKTIDLIFGLPPLNQYDASASDLRDLFTDAPDFTPYDFRRPTFRAQAKASWRRLVRGIDFSRPDTGEVALRRAVMKSEGLPRTLDASRRGRRPDSSPP
jgi:DNA-binding beta-propeller fold protein YncE